MAFEGAVLCVHETGLAGNVTESQLVLLAALWASKSRDELLGQGMITLFQKPENRENGVLRPVKNHLGRVRLPTSFALKASRGRAGR